jgi:hypothetical protein
MASRFRIPAVFGTLAVVLVVSGLSAAERTKPKRPIPNPKFDPDAERVGLFEGIEKGQIDARLIAKDATNGKVLIENKTDKTITVEYPETVMAVHVLKQFDMGMDGGMGGGMGGMGGMGGGQMMGGGMGGMGMGGMGGGMGGMGMGMGMFSIPPEQVVQVPFKSVCLEHGKPDPTPKMTYRLVKAEDVSDDPVLMELLKLVANGRIHPQVAQAAAWHLTDGMSWQELAAKQVKHLGGISKPYFSQRELYAAMQLHAQAVARAKEHEDGDNPAPRRRTIPVRTLR